MGRPDAAVLVRRAISVQLATVARGQPRLLQSTRTGRSAAYTGVAALLPKLIVGKVVLLNFWATWCVPCLSEMPRFVAWQQEYGGRGLQVIGISMDDEEQPVRITYQKYRLNYPVVMGDEKIGEMYGGIFGLPVTFLIDRNGKIRFKHEGDTDIKTIESEMRGLLSVS